MEMYQKINYILIRIYIVMTFLLYGHVSGYGKSLKVQLLEGEIRAGYTLPVGSYHSGKPEISMCLGLEGRYNIPRTAWDGGVMLELSSARRKYCFQEDKRSNIWQGNRTLAFALTGAYNLRQGHKMNPFVGIGVGVGVHDIVGDDVFPSHGASGFFSPRIGIEMFHHIRFSLATNLSRKGYNNLALSIGIVLGGRRKN